MKFQKKIFLAIFVTSTVISLLASVFLYSKYKSQKKYDFEQASVTVARNFSNTLVELEKKTDRIMALSSEILLQKDAKQGPVSYTHLTLPTTPYV